MQAAQGTVTLTPIGEPDEAINATLENLFVQPGFYHFKVNVTVDWNIGTGDVTWFGQDDIEIGQTVVDVEKLQYRIGNGAYADTPDPLVVPLGQSVNFKAIPKPAGAGWPEEKPAWSSTGTGVTGAEGTGESKSVSFSEIGDKTISVECGNTKTVNIKVVSVELAAVRFTSDHDRLKNKSDNYQDGGTVYADLHPEEYRADPPHNYPMTHSWDSKISLELTLAFSANAAGRTINIAGTGLGGFQKNGVVLPANGTEVTVAITATNKFIGKAIEIVDESIDWTITDAATGRELDAHESGSHKIYVTLGVPDESAPDNASKVTVWRVEQAVPRVAAAIEAGKEDCHPNTVWRINGQLGAYSLSLSLPSPEEWRLPSVAGGADCYTISRYVRAVCMVMGIPGTFGADTYYAHYKMAVEPNRPKTALSGSLNTPNIYPGDAGVPSTTGLNANWFLALADVNCKKFGNPAVAPGTVGCGPNGLNAFEAAVVYTYNGKTYYAPGGTGDPATGDIGLFYENKDHVVQIFQTLAWVDFGDHDSNPLTAEKLVVKAVDFTYTTPGNVNPCP